MPAEPQIQRLPPSAAEDSAVVRHLTGLINRVYYEAEAPLWREAVARTDSDEIAGSIAAGQVIVARRGIPDRDLHRDDVRSDRTSGDSDGPFIAAVQAHVTDGLGWFGMLAVDPRHRGEGLGKRLVRAAEDRVRAAGATRIEISVIMASDGSFTPKIELVRWYQHLGYELAGTLTVAQGIPGLETLLAVPCYLQIMRKDLVSTR